MADIHARQRFVEGISTRDERLFKRDHKQLEHDARLAGPGRSIIELLRREIRRAAHVVCTA